MGESGTAARLFTAAAAFCGAPQEPLEVHGHGSLTRRSSPALFEALRTSGVQLEFLVRPDAWPVRLHPLGPPSTVTLAHPSSSQEVSALLLALAAYPDSILLEVTGDIPSSPYVELTRQVLARFGVDCPESRSPGMTRYEVHGPLRAPLDRLAIEADASSAAVALCAACISAGEAQVPGLPPDSAQGDRRIAEWLRAFGCEAELDATGLTASGAPRQGAELDLASTPDLAPPLAVVAAAAARAGHSSRLAGLGTLRGKESDRLAELERLLAALGCRTESTDDSLSIRPGAGPATDRPQLLDPAGDHRMAFAIALAGLLQPGLLCTQPSVCAKSWPGFWEDLESLGASTFRAP